MSRTRQRLLPPAALVGGLLLGAAAPAQASLSATATVPRMTVSTAVVAPPTQVTITSTSCTTMSSSGTRSSQLQVQISWSPSTSVDVTGYVVTGAFSDGSRRPLASVGGSTTSTTVTYASSSGPQTIRFTVTTTTGYGWTAESAPSKAVTC